MQDLRIFLQFIVRTIMSLPLKRKWKRKMEKVVFELYFLDFGEYESTYLY